MAKVTIYLPDERAKRVRAHESLNVSETCRRALVAELRSRDAAPAKSA